LKELDVQHFSELIQSLSSALVVDPPSTTQNGGFIASGYSKELDELRRLSKEGTKVIEALLTEYKAKTGLYYIPNNKMIYLCVVSLLHNSLFFFCSSYS
jgi:DNA mismatch repair protein MutS